VARIHFRVPPAQAGRAPGFQGGRQDGRVQGFGQAVDRNAAARFGLAADWQARLVQLAVRQGGRVLQAFQLQVFGQGDEPAFLALQDARLLVCTGFVYVGG
jgi:hypothetical protein